MVDNLVGCTTVIQIHIVIVNTGKLEWKKVLNMGFILNFVISWKSVNMDTLKLPEKKCIKISQPLHCCHQNGWNATDVKKFYEELISTFTQAFHWDACDHVQNVQHVLTIAHTQSQFLWYFPLLNPLCNTLQRIKIQ